MKTIPLIVTLLLFLATVGFAVCPCQQSVQTFSGANAPRGIITSEENVSYEETVGPGKIKNITIETPSGIKIHREIGEGSKILEIFGKKTNKTIIITNTTKEIYISTPKSTIQIIKDLENETKEMHIITPNTDIKILKTGNETPIAQIEKMLNRPEGIEKITLNPERARIRARLRIGNETEILPVMARIRAKIRNRFVDVTFNETSKQVEFHFGNITVVTKREVEIENGTIWIRTEKIRKRITVLPEEAAERARSIVNFHMIRAVEIDTEGNTTVYKIKGAQVGKLFGLFQVNVPVETGVDTESAQVVKVKRPWWAFLVRLAK